MKTEIQDGRKHSFYIIYNTLIDDFAPQIGVYGIAIYNVLARYAGDRHEAWPSYQTIAKHLGISRRKVMITIDLLIKTGLIVKEARQLPSGDATSNRYTLLGINSDGSAHNALGGAPPSEQDAPPSARQSLPSEQGAPQVVHDNHHGGAPHAPEEYSLNKTHSDKDANEEYTGKTDHDDEDNAGARERRSRKTEPEVATVFEAWQDNCPGTLTPHLSEILIDLTDECGSNAVVYGIKTAVEAGARNFKYVAACARNHAAGKEPPSNRASPNRGHWSRPTKVDGSMAAFDEFEEMLEREGVNSE